MPRLTNRRNFLLYIAVLATLLILANMISRRLFFRWDLTANKIFTLSESSRQVIGELDDRMLVKVYFSDNLPGEYANNRRYVQDILEEYQAYSGGRMHFEFFKPEDNEELEREAQKYGIPPMQLQAIENDQLTIKNVWMGMALLYGDERETIPIIQTTAGLEYEITLAVKKLLDTERRTVALVRDPEGKEKYRNIQDLLRQVYAVRQIDLDRPVPPDVDLLIIAAVKDSLAEKALYYLDQYIMSGRPLIAAQNSVEADLNRGFARKLENNNFLDALEHYGVQVTPNLLADRVCSQIAVETVRGLFRIRNAVNYPFFPVIQRFDDRHPMVSGLEQALLFFTNEVASSIDSSRLESALFQPLLWTSDYTAVQSGPGYNLRHQDNPLFANLNGPGRAVAGLLTGAVTSLFTEEAPLDSADADLIPGTVSARILVIGDGGFFSDDGGGGIKENLNLVINAVDYLVGDEELIAIRSREVTTRPLKELSDASRRTWKWSNILTPSVLMVAMGLWRWRSGHRRRKLLEEAYAK